MQAIILAGGMGTRLRPLTYTTPKPMLPVGGKPALVCIASELAKAGVEEVFITTNYLAEIIEAGIAAYDLPIPVHCIREEKPLGTAGCVKNAIDRLGDEFLVIQGDAVADVEYSRLIDSHRQRNADVTITAIRVSDPREFGILEVDEEGCIIRFQEKPRLDEAFSDLANAGFYILKKEVFDCVPHGEPFDFSRHLFPELMRQKRRFCAWELGGYWVDIGRPASYLEGNCHAIAGLAQVAPDVKVPASATLSPPFVIEPGVHLEEHVSIGPGAVIGRRCKIGAGALLSGCVLFEDVTVGDGAQLTDCVVASRSRIGARASIGALAIIGEACDIGADAQVAPHSKVGPITPVAAGTMVEGVVSPRTERLDSIQRTVVQSVLGRPALKLTDEQDRVHSLLAEFGELTVVELSRATEFSLEDVSAALGVLEAEGMVLSTLDVPKRYALTREITSPSHRILFVDDHEDMRAMFALAFRVQGHSVHQCADGKAAVAAVEAEGFSAIVMDVLMPGMDGFETVRLIRELENGRDVPIVMYTGHADDQTYLRAAEVGANVVLPKPILPQELLTRVVGLMK